MGHLNTMCHSGFIILMQLIFFTSVKVTAHRCNFAVKPENQKTVWKSKGEDVTLTCPGYKPASETFSVEYSWFKDYDCNGDDNNMRIAYFADDPEGGTRVIVKDEDKMTINKTSAGLIIRNLTFEDEDKLTCIFLSSTVHAATVDLKVKEFKAPVLTGVPEVFNEMDIVTAECHVPRMHPTKGFMEVKVNHKVMGTVNLEEGLPYVPVYSVQITGEANAEGNVVTCTAVQNISGVAEQLSTSVIFTIQSSYHTQVVPSLPDPPMEFTNMTLSCEVTREVNPAEISEYTWLKDGREIPTDHDQSMVMRNTTVDDSGSYQCLITNIMNISTLRNDAHNLQLDVVPLRCLPQLNFNSNDINLDRSSLVVSWKILYPCRDHRPDVEMCVQVHAENETENIDYRKTASVSEKQVAIYGSFDISQNHEVCLLFINYEDVKYCALTKVKSDTDVLSLAVYVGIGCVVLAVVVGFICWAKCSASRKKQGQVSPIIYGHYEELEMIRRRAVARERGVPRNPILESINPYDQSNPPEECLPIPTPPPLPDVRNFPQSLDVFRVSDRHYTNRMAIAATFPKTRKRSRLSIAKTDSLGDLIEYCKDNYGAFSKEMETKGESAADEYVVMNDGSIVTAAEVYTIETDLGNASQKISMDCVTQKEGSDIQGTESEEISSGIYLDMSASKIKTDVWNDSKTLATDSESVTPNEGNNTQGLPPSQGSSSKPPLPPIPEKKQTVDSTASRPPGSLETAQTSNDNPENKQLKNETTSGINSSEPPLPPLPEKRDMVGSTASQPLEASENVQENKSLVDEQRTSGIYMDMTG